MFFMYFIIFQRHQGFSPLLKNHIYKVLENSRCLQTSFHTYNPSPRHNRLRWVNTLKSPKTTLNIVGYLAIVSIKGLICALVVPVPHKGLALRGQYVHP